MVSARPAGYGNDSQQTLEASEIVGVGGVERQRPRHRDGGDHLVGHAGTGRATGGTNRGCHPAVGAGGVAVERNGFEGALDALQLVDTFGQLGSAQGGMDAGRQLGEGDGGDGADVGQQAGGQSFPMNEDVGVENARLPGLEVSGHRDRRRVGRPSNRCRRATGQGRWW